MQVTKRNGQVEEFDIQKIKTAVNWAIRKEEDVSYEEIIENTKLNAFDGIKTSDIHNLIIESAANLISIEKPDYQYVAGRLLNYKIRKEVWKSLEHPKLINIIQNNIGLGVYSLKLTELYSLDEIEKIDSFICHDRDLNYTYCSVKQLIDKYLVKNQKTKQIFETPQFRYIVAAMYIFKNYPKDIRLNYIKSAYDKFSLFKINLATPQLSGLGTNHNSFASCCLIDFLDNSESINAMNHAVSNATRAAYGIGVNYGRMRSINTSIRNGAIIHPGVVPFLKITEASVKAWQKNGVRGGSATVTFPIWHLEIENIVQLKNATTGTPDSRVFNLDYSIAISKLFYKRFLENKNITLFSPNEVQDLYEAFGLETFDELYEKYEKDNTKTKKTVSARDLFSSLVRERLETGRIYIINIDNANKYSPWVGKVNFSNLCQEVLHNIEPIKKINDETGEIGVCILSALNWLNIESDGDLEQCCDIVVRMLDEIIEIQDYFDLSAERFAKGKRSLGIGITNLAAFLAYNGVKYGDEKSINLVDEYMERQQYYLIKSSINLAKEKGKLPNFNSTKYSNGWLPIDKDNRFISKEFTCDWESLRKDLIQYGIRHSTLTCMMPVESSSAVQNATNGVEPIRSLITYKSSKKSSIPFLVPGIGSYEGNYELAFETKNNSKYHELCNVIQYWTDMAMSVNQYFNPSNFEDGKISYSLLIKEMIEFWKNGGKCIYYCNSNDNNKHFEENNDCSNGACKL